MSGNLGGFNEMRNSKLQLDPKRNKKWRRPETEKENGVSPSAGNKELKQLRVYDKGDNAAQE